MDKRIADLERTIADLTRTLDGLRERIGALEAHLDIRPQSLAPSASVIRSRATAAASDTTPVVTLLGRTCVVLGGAYLLRALTEGGSLPRAGGTALGLVYGAAWLVAAWRVLAAGRLADAVFHTVAAVLIAFPLIWESSIQFHVLSPATAAVAMAAVTTIGLLAAAHRRVQPIAWIVDLAGICAALAFLAASGGASTALFLAYLGIVTLWLGYTLDWTWLRWPPAIVADVAVLVMVADAGSAWRHDQAAGVMAVQLVLFAAYVVSFTARTLWRSRQVVPFEVVQSLALLVVCFGGAVYLMVATGSNALGLGVASLVFGAGSYAAAFAFVDWRGGHWRNFVFYASLGIVLTLAGTALVVAPALQATAWAVLAIVTASGGRRYGSVTLASHAAIYVVAAGIASGLLAGAFAGLMAPATDAWPPLTLPAAAVLAAALTACAVPSSSRNESWGRWSRLPKIVLAAVVLWAAGGVLCGLSAPLLAGQPGSNAVDSAIVATIRTAVLAASVLLLAWAGTRFFAEGRWFSYAVLVAGGAKLLAEDFPQGRPATLFVSLAVYGGVLILGPRLRTRPADTPRAHSPAQTG